MKTVEQCAFVVICNVCRGKAFYTPYIPANGEILKPTDRIYADNAIRTMQICGCCDFRVNISFGSVKTNTKHIAFKTNKIT